MVRAKIAHLSWRQHPELPSLEDFERYLKLAGDFSRPRPVFLCITHGFSGSGKSFISRRLAAQLDALHLRSDVERKRLAGLAAVAPSKSPLGGGIYRQDFTQRTYQKLLEDAYTILTSGYPAIVDATFLTQAWRLKFKDLAQSLKLPFLILNFSAPEEVLRQRILKRRQERRDPSEADLKVLEYQLCHHEPLDSSEQALTLTLDTTAEDGERMLRALQVRLGLK
jgi:predicted kinase